MRDEGADVCSSVPVSVISIQKVQMKRKYLVFYEPVDIEVMEDKWDDGTITYSAEMENFSTCVSAPNVTLLRNLILGEVLASWTQYACTADDKLSEDAQKVKYKLQTMAEEIDMKTEEVEACRNGMSSIPMALSVCNRYSVKSLRVTIAEIDGVISDCLFYHPEYSVLTQSANFLKLDLDRLEMSVQYMERSQDDCSSHEVPVHSILADAAARGHCDYLFWQINKIAAQVVATLGSVVFD